MAVREYGTKSLDDRQQPQAISQEVDAEGNPIPVGPDGKLILTDAEYERRLDEKLALQRQQAAERGTRAPIPTAKPVPVDPIAKEQLDQELSQARADLAGLQAAETEARKQEQAILAQADKERKDRRQALIAHADEIQAKVAAVEAQARAAKLTELAGDHASAEARNAARAEAGIDAQRAELEQRFRPILNEIEATMKEANEFIEAYGDSLRTLSAQTFSTSDASFPISVRQKLSADVYRPAERLLNDIAIVQACGSAGGDPRWDVVLRNSIAAGKLISPEGMTLTMQYARAFNREHVRSWERALAQITLRLEQLTQQGRAQAGTPPQIIIRIDDRARQEAARDARLGKIDSTRPATADMSGGV